MWCGLLLMFTTQLPIIFIPVEQYIKTLFHFWEFVAGPLNAATLRPHRLDKTFGAQREFLSMPEDRRGPGRSPLDGEQFYGVAESSEEGRQLKVSLHNLEGQQIYQRVLNSSI